MNVGLLSRKHTVRSCVVGILSFLFLFSGQLTVHAAQDDRFSGWAWSDNIGWISLNCTNTNSCETVDYGVTVTGTGGTQPLSGWAWSENIGWIDFSHVTMLAANRSLFGEVLVYSTVEEPYCSFTDSYQTSNTNTTGPTGGVFTCTDSAQNDGWDGVIEVSSSTPVSYGPIADAIDDTDDGWEWSDNQFYLMDGYMWGGEVVGWIKLSCQDSDGAGPDSNSCGTVGYGTYLDPFYMHFTADAGLDPLGGVDHGGSFNHQWILIPDADIQSCTGSAGPGTWADSPNKGTSPSPLSQLVTDVYEPSPGATSTLACTNFDNKTLTREMFVYIKPPPPIVTFTSSDYNIPYNADTTLIWTTQNITSCEASAGDASWTGAIATGTNQTYTTENLTTDTTYNMTCQSMYPDYFDPVLATLEITIQRLIVDFYAEDGAGNRINDPNELYAYTEKDDINLVWETEFATGGCEASGNWSGTKVPVDLTNDIVDDSELAPIPEGGTFTYTLTCDGVLGQQIARSVTIRVAKNPDFSEEISNDLQ